MIIPKGNERLSKIAKDQYFIFSIDNALWIPGKIKTFWRETLNKKVFLYMKN